MTVDVGVATELAVFNAVEKTYGDGGFLDGSASDGVLVEQHMADHFDLRHLRLDLRQHR